MLLQLAEFRCSASAHGSVGGWIGPPPLVHPLSFLLFQPILNGWFNKDCGVYCATWGGAGNRSLAAGWKEKPVVCTVLCEVVLGIDPLLLAGKRRLSCVLCYVGWCWE